MLSGIGEEDLNKGCSEEKNVIKVTYETAKPSETDTEIKEYYNLKLNKDLVDNSLNNVGESSKVVVEKIVPELGVSVAVDAATSAAVKTTVGMPLPQRMLTIGTIGAVSAIGTKIGLGVGNSITKNMDIKNIIKNSPHADLNPDRIPSPDMNFINSPLERNELTSPIQELLFYSFVLDVSTLILFFIVILLLLNKYFIIFNFNFLNYISKKFLPIKFSNWVNKNINKSTEINTKLNKFLIIYNCFLIFLFILLKIFITSELLVNIDSYVSVYNSIFPKKS
jgi:hypothetical protein